MRVLSLPIVEKKKKWPRELMTKLIPPYSDPRMFEIRICTMDIVLGLKNIGIHGVGRLI